MGSLVPRSPDSARCQPQSCWQGLGWGQGQGQGQHAPWRAAFSFCCHLPLVISLFPRGRGQSKNGQSPEGALSTFCGPEAGGGQGAVTGALGLPAGSVCHRPPSHFWPTACSCFISFYFPGRCLESSGQRTRAAGGSWNEGPRGFKVSQSTQDELDARPYEMGPCPFNRRGDRRGPQVRIWTDPQNGFVYFFSTRKPCEVR